jgi:hypothetical protein
MNAYTRVDMESYAARVRKLPNPHPDFIRLAEAVDARRLELFNLLTIAENTFKDQLLHAGWSEEELRKAEFDV